MRFLFDAQTSLPSGSPQRFCDICGKDITEVTGRYRNVELLAELQSAGCDHIAVCRYIVDYLRRESAPVDGVCAREEVSALGEVLICLGVGEDALYTGLCVVEVALDGGQTITFSPSCVDICSFCTRLTPYTG